MSELPIHSRHKEVGIGINLSGAIKVLSRHDDGVRHDDELKAYLNSEYQKQPTANRFEPVIQERAIVSYELT